MVTRKAQIKTKRQEQAENTKRRIYETAARLIEEHGFEHVTVDEICTMAGVAKGGFYHHFPSKGELIIETYRRIDSEFTEALQELPVDTPPRDSILFTTCFIAQTANERGYEFCREIYKGQLDWGTEFLLSRNRPFYRRIYQSVVKSLEGKKSLVFPSADDLTKMFLFSTRGAVYDWSLSQGTYNIAILVKQTIGFLYDGIFK